MAVVSGAGVDVAAGTHDAPSGAAGVATKGEGSDGQRADRASPEYWAEKARVAEQQATEYPDDAVECSLEAATAWLRAGDLDRAEMILRRLLAESDRDQQTDDDSGIYLAWPTLIEVLLAAGKDDLAAYETERLRASAPTASASLAMAELLEERGDRLAALDWADRAVADWGGGDLAGALTRLRAEAGPFVVLTSGIGLRANVRASLGYEPDELDRLADRTESALRESVLGGAGRPRPSSRTTEVRGSFWPRGALEEAARRWPSLVPAEAVESGRYWADLERKYAEIVAGPGTYRVVLVPFDPDALAALAASENTSVEDDGLRGRLRDTQIERGLATSWPPPRNGPCWCGSTRKYKKCCGAPAAH